MSIVAIKKMTKYCYNQKMIEHCIKEEWPSTIAIEKWLSTVAKVAKSSVVKMTDKITK
jgi:hypothetical protein